MHVGYRLFLNTGKKKKIKIKAEERWRAGGEAGGWYR